jgi:hypothetical protein
MKTKRGKSIEDGTKSELYKYAGDKFHNKITKIL